jgi:7,8-dihydro-6-hydroxymethylpterin-pyrophosphokinase
MIFVIFERCIAKGKVKRKHNPDRQNRKRELKPRNGNLLLDVDIYIMKSSLTMSVNSTNLSHKDYL